MFAVALCQKFPSFILLGLFALARVPTKQLSFFFSVLPLLVFHKQKYSPYQIIAKYLQLLPPPPHNQYGFVTI
jgi:hypothetical protein